MYRQRRIGAKKDWKKDWLLFAASLFLFACFPLLLSAGLNPFQPAKPDTVQEVAVPYRVQPQKEDIPAGLPGNASVSLPAFTQPSLLRGEDEAEGKIYNPFLTDSLFNTLIIQDTSLIRQQFFPGHLLQPDAGQSGERRSVGQDWIFVVLVIAFLLLAAVQYQYPRRFSQVIRAFSTARYVNQLSRGGDFYRERITYNLFLIFLLTFPLLLYVINQFYGLYPLSRRPFTEFLFYLELFMLNLVLYAGKIIAIRSAGSLFKTGDISSEYQLTHFVFSLVQGVFLLFLLSLVVYTRALWVLQAGLGLFALIYAFQLFRGVIIGMGSKGYPLFYLLIYFFTLELLPLLVLYKLISLAAS